MRDPLTYRSARRTTAKDNLHWKRGLAQALNYFPRPTWPQIWPAYYARDFLAGEESPSARP